jgi:hypothetical protein
MNKRTAHKSRPAGLSNKAAGNLPWSYFVVIAICGCILAAGFLLAARQHFVSMDLGMKNSKLRKQLDDLESENRRLTLAREIALSPAEITRTARAMGFVDVNAVRSAAILAVQPVTVEKKKESETAGAAAGITRTVSQRPAVTARMEDRRDQVRTSPAMQKIPADLTAVAKLR